MMIPAAALPVMLWLPLQASVNGHSKVVQQLLAAGADPLAQNKEKRTAVDMAKTPELAQLLQAHKASS
jgi:ankyrin repeat protein